MATSKAIGTALELRVARALQRGGYTAVQRNVILKDAHGNRSEIDVAYDGAWWRRMYVECKAYHGSGSSVGLEEVAKFKEVLSLNRIPISRGLFITTSSFVPRARTTGVRTLDGVELAAWERGLARRGLLRRVCAAGALVGLVGLAAAALAHAADSSALAQQGGSGVAAQARQGWAEGTGAAPPQGSAWLAAAAAPAKRSPGEALAHGAGLHGGAALARLRAWWAGR